MDDIEKNRVEYVAHLENQVKHLQRQLAVAKPLAEKWTPIVSGESTLQDDKVRFTVAFGGKRMTVALSKVSVNQNTVGDVTHTIATTIAEQLLQEQVKEIIRPEVERVKRGVDVASGAAKW